MTSDFKCIEDDTILHCEILTRSLSSAAGTEYSAGKSLMSFDFVKCHYVYWLFM